MGSLAEYAALGDAFARYHRVVVLTAFFQPGPAEARLVVFNAERDAYRELMACAARCGWSITGDETAADWTARRLDTFIRTFGRG